MPMNMQHAYTRIKQWLEPPQFAGDEEQNRVARLTNTLGLYFMFVLVVAAVIFVPFFAIHKTLAWMIIIALMALYALSRYLLFHGQVETSSAVVVIGAWMIFQGLVIFSGGIASPVSVAAVATIILIALLVQPRAGTVIVLLSSLIGLGSAILQTNGVELPMFFTFTPLVAWFWFTLTIWFVFGTVNIVTRDLRAALMLVRHQSAARQQAEATLRTSEARFRAVVEHSHDGIIFLDRQRKVLYASPSYEQVNGMTPQELIGQSGIGFVHPDDREYTAVTFRDLLQQPGATILAEYRTRHKDGSWRWIETKATNLLDEPHVQAVVLNSRDVTERKHAEEALRESAQRFRQMFDSHSAIMLLVDPDSGAIADANPAAAAFYGYARDALQHMAIDAINMLPPQEVAAARQLIKSKQRYNWVFPHRLANGEIRTVEVHSSPVDFGGQLLLFSIIQDVTERQRTEDKLRASEERFRSLYENTAIGIYRTTPQGRILMANPALVGMLGYETFEELAQRDLTQAGYEPDSPRTDFQKRIEQEGKVTGVDSAWQRRDGTTFFVRESARLVLDENSQPLYYDGTVEDITERKRSDLRQEILHQVLRAVSGHLDLDLVARSAVETLVALTGYPHVCLVMLAEDGATWIVRGAAGSLAAELGATYSTQQGVIGRALRTGETQWVRDVLDDPGYVRDVSAVAAPALRSEVVALLRRGDHLLGALNVESDRVDAFSEDDVALMQSLAGVIALAWEQVRLYEEAQWEIGERKRAEEKVSATLEEKEALLREVHHRVKNNLQVIIALIRMQSKLVHDDGMQQFLKELSGQAHTMSLVYEQLYQSENLSRIAMKSYLQQLTSNVLKTFGRGNAIQLHLDAPVSLDVAEAMPCGLIVNELFTNILKYAFPPGFAGSPAVAITLRQDGEAYHLTVSDNGVGLPHGYDWQSHQTLGLRLVDLWATHQLGGTLDVTSEAGTTFAITFDLKG
jgi:PAS domain S-box-containing protein